MANNKNGLEVTPKLYKIVIQLTHYFQNFQNRYYLVLETIRILQSLCVTDVNQFEETPFLYPQQMLCYGSEIAKIPQRKLQLKKVLGISNHLSCGFLFTFALASNTIRNFVAAFSSRTTGN